jgi:hypothetical protein
MTVAADPTFEKSTKSDAEVLCADEATAGLDNTSFPSSIPFSAPSSAYDASPSDLEEVRPLDTHCPYSRFRALPWYDRIALLMVAGLMHGGEVVELTINIPVGKTWAQIRRHLVTALKAAGWSGRHVWVEVRPFVRKNGKPVQHHVHVALFDSQNVQSLLEEFRFEALIARKRSFAIRYKSARAIANYFSKNCKWDRGKIGADKATLREAHALGKLTARQLWDLWRETAPGKVDGLPDVPPVLADREAVHTVTLKPRRKRAAIKAAKAHARDLRRIDRATSLPAAEPAPIANPAAESKESDQVMPHRGVAAPASATPVATLRLDCGPVDGGDVPASDRPAVFGDFDLAEDTGAFDLAAEEPGAFDLLLVYDRPALSARCRMSAISSPA